MNDHTRALEAELNRRAMARDAANRNANGEFSSSAGGTELEKEGAAQKAKVEKANAEARAHNAKIK